MRRICAAAVVAGMTILLTLSAWKNHTYPSKTEVEPEYVFSYAENQPEDYPTTLGAKYFAELVEERTNGRIRILVQPVGVLGSENKVIKQMQYGGIDFTRVSLAQLAEYIPSLNVLQMPYLYTDSDHMWRVLDGEIGDAFLESVSADDVIGLSWYDAGARNFYNSVKPVTCLEDLKGMRIRVQESDLAVDMVEALGATAIPIAYGDVYASLERQVVDGAENNWPPMRRCGTMRSRNTIRWTSTAECRKCRSARRIPGRNCRRKTGRLSWNVPENRRSTSVRCGHSARSSRAALPWKTARKWWSFPLRKKNGSRMPCTGYMKNTAGMTWDSSKKS